LQDLKQPIDEDQLRLVLVEAADIRDSYLGDATAAAGLCKQSGGKKRKSDKEVGTPQYNAIFKVFQKHSLDMGFFSPHPTALSQILQTSLSLSPG
jgi:hypothetical protein